MGSTGARVSQPERGEMELGTEGTNHNNDHCVHCCSIYCAMVFSPIHNYNIHLYSFNITIIDHFFSVACLVECGACFQRGLDAVILEAIPAWAGPRLRIGVSDDLGLGVF